MSNKFENSYFSILPDEILLKIFSNVDTFSVLNFCSVYQCYYFLRDRKVIQSIDLSRQYKLTALADIANKIVFEYVTTLNVNCVYWITGTKLREFIKKLENLETLYAIQTNLSLGESDLETLGGLAKLRKLGVSIHRTDALGNHSLPSILILYVHVINVKSLAGRSIASVFPSVQNLWIDVKEACGRETILYSLGKNNRTKIFCQVSPPVPFIDFDHYSLTTYYSTRRRVQPYVICCEKFSQGQIPTRKSELIIQSWKTLTGVHYSIPYNPKDARRLFLQETTLDNIFFEELNFSHTAITCVTRCRAAVEEILKSSSAQRLKRLCVMMCLFQNKNLQDCVNLENSNGFARKRMGVEKSVQAHPVEEIFRNFLGLQHLQIFVCNDIAHHGAIQGYALISLFERLESLIIEVPVTVDGSFLIEVFNKCKNLQVLKIISASQNERLNQNLCAAICNATALKDFRYETYRIQVDRLLQQLCLMKSKTLERIALECKETDRFSHGPFKEFLDLNPQLVFLFFILSGCPEAAVRKAQRLLNTYKKDHPSKVFFVKRTHVFHTEGFPIPDVHFYEMIRSQFDASNLRPLEQFQSF